MPKEEKKYNAKGREMCDALKKDGNRCRSDILLQNGRCHVHSGKTPAGPASPQYKGKGRSRYMPERLQERFAEAMNDPQLLSARADLSEIEARLDDLYRQLDTGESGAVWAALKVACNQLQAANNRRPEPDMIAAAQAMNRILTLVNQGNLETSIWNERYDLFDLRRKLIDTETRREQRGQQMIAAARVVMMLQAVSLAMQEAVLTYVEQDSKLARNILFEARRRLAGFLRQSTDRRDLPPGV